MTDWYGPDVATFGDRVAAAREHGGMSQEILAKRLGIRLPTLRKWENDVSEPRANRLSILAGLLNVSMMWLINGEGEGLEAPGPDTAEAHDIDEILSEIRVLRTDLRSKVETLGRLEKRLRTAVREQRLV